jgi:hypothetical protein
MTEFDWDIPLYFLGRSSCCFNSDRKLSRRLFTSDIGFGFVKQISVHYRAIVIACYAVGSDMVEGHRVCLKGECSCLGCGQTQAIRRNVRG